MKTPRIPALLAAVALLANSAMGQGPPLPAGLGGAQETETTAEGNGSDTPALPAGLGGDGGTDRDEAAPPDASAKGLSLPFNVHGFVDTRAGFRTRDDPYHDGLPLAETRLQLGVDRRWANFGFRITGDLLYDHVQEERDQVDLTRGTGWLDLREAHVLFSPVPWMDVKAGRQILTWGTGDQLFINDNFPKDWVSFFAGRDVEYLKAPSDAVKAAMFFPALNLDVVYTPQFDPDRFISGARFSYYNAALGRRAGEDAVTPAAIPDEWFDDDELALRAYRNVEAYEVAAYSYFGYWKSPGGQQGGFATFPPLHVYGASVRGPVAAGIGNVEIGYMDSRDDRDGADPAVKNSEWRVLVGYEQDLSELASDFTVGVQYYLEHMQDYDAYLASLPAGIPERDEDRHVLTLRLTKLMLQQNLELSLFSYYSPSDEDAFIRPRVSYAVTDAWDVTAGANLFVGRHPHTFFGQFQNNTNVYGAVRYSF